MPGSGYRYSATFDATYNEEDQALLSQNFPLNFNGKPSEPSPLQVLLEADCKNSSSLCPSSESSFSCNSSTGSPYHARSSSVDSLDSNGGGSTGSSSFSRQISLEGTEGGIPTRKTSKSSFKPAHNPLQFVKLTTSPLYKEAEQQIKMAKEVKISKDSLKEEEEWQSNLDNWKSRRRKSSIRPEDNPLLSERENKNNSRKIKTFSEIVEKRGNKTRYNLAFYTSQNDSYDEKSNEETEDKKEMDNSSDDSISKHSHKEDENKEENRVLASTKQPQHTNGITTNGDSGLDSLTGSHQTALTTTTDTLSDFSQDSSLELDYGQHLTTGTELLKEFSSKTPPSQDIGRVQECEDAGLELYLRVRLKPSQGEPIKEDFGFNVVQDDVLIVDTLTPGGASEQAGLRVGDRLMGVNGCQNLDYDGLMEMLAQACYSGNLELLVWRQTCTNNLTLQWQRSQGKLMSEEKNDTEEPTKQNSPKIVTSTQNSLVSRHKSAFETKMAQNSAKEMKTEPIRSEGFKDKVKSFEKLSLQEEEDKLLKIKKKYYSTKPVDLVNDMVTRCKSLDNCYIPSEEMSLSNQNDFKSISFSEKAVPVIKNSSPGLPRSLKNCKSLNTIFQSPDEDLDIYNIPVSLVTPLLGNPPKLYEPPKEKPPPLPPMIEELPIPQPQKEQNQSSARKIKKEICKRRTDFLGIESSEDQLIGELHHIQPPPTIEDILKNERDIERDKRQLLEKEMLLHKQQIQQEIQPVTVYNDWTQYSRDLEEKISKSNNKIKTLKEERRKVQQNNWPHSAPQSVEDEEFVKLHDQLSLWEREGNLRIQEENLRKERERLHLEQETLRKERQQYHQILEEKMNNLKNNNNQAIYQNVLVTSRQKQSPSAIIPKISPAQILKAPEKPERLKAGLNRTKDKSQSRSRIPQQWPEKLAIPKKKPDSKYNQNHWLIQEAEMRRISEHTERMYPEKRSLEPVPANYPIEHSYLENGNYSSVPTPSSRPDSREENCSYRTEPQKLSVSGRKKCSHCKEELGRGAAMIIESLQLYYHIECFRCCVCQAQLGNGSCGMDVRVRNNKLHCQLCYSNDEAGLKFSQV